MHGLILAGGEGSRLAASGVTTPKALLPVGGVPQLLRLARTLERLGCLSLTCLVRDDVSLDPVADDLARLRVPCQVRTCRTPSSLHTLVDGLGVAPPGPVFCTMVDTVMPQADWTLMYREAGRALAAGADAVLAVTSFINDARPLFVAADADGQALAIGSAPMRPSLATGGVYGFGAAARTMAGAVLAAGHERMRAFLGAMVRQGRDVRVVRIAKIIDLDDRGDLDLANAWQDSCDDGGTPMG